MNKTQWRSCQSIRLISQWYFCHNAIPAQIAEGLSRKCYVRFICPQVHLGHL